MDKTVGIAQGNEEESIYAVLSGTHFNGEYPPHTHTHPQPPALTHPHTNTRARTHAGGCCFDYGNSESNDVSKAPLPLGQIFSTITQPNPTQTLTQ